MEEEKPRFQDGKQGVSHDRILMRIKDYIQIATSIGALVWGGYRVVLAFDRQNQQINILQQQISSLQNLVVNTDRRRNR